MADIPAAAPEAVKTQTSTAIQDGAAAKAAMLAAVTQIIKPDDVPAPQPQTPANVPAEVTAPAPVDEALLSEATRFGMTPERVQELGPAGTRAALDCVLHMFARSQPAPVNNQPEPKQPDSPQSNQPTKQIPAAPVNDEIDSILKQVEEEVGPDAALPKLLRKLVAEVATVKVSHEATEKENSRVRKNFDEYGTKLDVLDFEDELRRVPNAEKVLGRIPWKKLKPDSPFFKTAQVALRTRASLRDNNFPMSANDEIASYVLRIIDTANAVAPAAPQAPATRDTKGMFAAQPTGAQIGNAPQTRTELVSGVAAIMARASGA